MLELEAHLRANPDDRAAWLVYGERGAARGGAVVRRVKTRTLLVGAVVGLVAFAGGCHLVQELQFRYNEHVAFVKLSVIGGIGAWIAVFFISAAIAHRVLARRAPAKLDELAKPYEVPLAKLAEIAELVRKL